MTEKLLVTADLPAHTTPASLLQHSEPSTNVQPLDLTVASVQKSPDIITSHNILNTWHFAVGAFNYSINKIIQWKQNLITAGWCKRVHRTLYKKNSENNMQTFLKENNETEFVFWVHCHEKHQYPILSHCRSCHVGPLSCARSFTGLPPNLNQMFVGWHVENFSFQGYV